MSTDHATEAPKHDLVRADKITDAAIKRQATVTIGQITGRLVSTFDLAESVTLVLVVGGQRAFFHLDPDTEVEVWRAGREPS